MSSPQNIQITKQIDPQTQTQIQSQTQKPQETTLEYQSISNNSTPLLSPNSSTDQFTIESGACTSFIHNTPNDSNNNNSQNSAKVSIAGKIFVGGLSKSTSTEKLKKYFQDFSPVKESIVIKSNEKSVKSRGFGFVTFYDPLVIDKLFQQEHIIDQKKVEIRKAIPKENIDTELQRQKLFVGGLPRSIDLVEFKNYFNKYGEIYESNLLIEKNGNVKGFGFVTFKDDSVNSKILCDTHVIHGKKVDVRIAESKKSNNSSGSFGVFGGGNSSLQSSSPSSPILASTSPIHNGNLISTIVMSHNGLLSNNNNNNNNNYNNNLNQTNTIGKTDEYQIIFQNNNNSNTTTPKTETIYSSNSTNSKNIVKFSGSGDHQHSGSLEHNSGTSSIPSPNNSRGAGIPSPNNSTSSSQSFQSKKSGISSPSNTTETPTTSNKNTYKTNSPTSVRNQPNLASSSVQPHLIPTTMYPPQQISMNTGSNSSTPGMQNQSPYCEEIYPNQLYDYSSPQYYPSNYVILPYYANYPPPYYPGQDQPPPPPQTQGSMALPPSSIKYHANPPPPPHYSIPLYPSSPIPYNQHGYFQPPPRYHIYSPHEGAQYIGAYQPQINPSIIQTPYGDMMQPTQNQPSRYQQKQQMKNQHKLKQQQQLKQPLNNPVSIGIPTYTGGKSNVHTSPINSRNSSSNSVGGNRNPTSINTSSSSGNIKPGSPIPSTSPIETPIPSPTPSFESIDNRSTNNSNNNENNNNNNISDSTEKSS